LGIYLRKNNFGKKLKRTIAQDEVYNLMSYKMPLLPITAGSGLIASGFVYVLYYLRVDWIL